LREIDRALRHRGEELGVTVESFQSNHEGALVDRVQQASGKAEALIINAGGYTHTSVALRDAIAGVGLPCIEVHLSNLAAREPFRHVSRLAEVCTGQITGLGAMGYSLALEAIVQQLARPRRGASRRSHASHKGGTR
jgi:3-dehydroquinate dehydratase-2